MSTTVNAASSEAPSSDAWIKRNKHWALRCDTSANPRPSRRDEPRALILCGHGVSLSIDRGTLLIRNGLTHYPQDREIHRFFRGGLDLPARIIVLDGSGSISFDVLSWLSEQGVSLVRIGWQGDTVTVIGGSGFALLQERTRWQFETRDDPKLRLTFAADLIGHKLAHSMDTLRDAVPRSAAKETAIAKADRAVDALALAQTIDAVRMIEAGAAASYFAAWKGMAIRWERLAKFPVPESWMTVGTRGAQNSNKTLTNRNATHPVSAILNYAYAALRSQVQIEAVTAGYNPTLGILHHSRQDAAAFVYDLMEIGRPWVDAQVLRFVQTASLRGSDFILRADGVVRLGPQLARRICISISESIRPVLPVIFAEESVPVARA
jgi:CRISPR-associated protein Cas1